MKELECLDGRTGTCITGQCQGANLICPIALAFHEGKPVPKPKELRRQLKENLKEIKKFEESMEKFWKSMEGKSLIEEMKRVLNKE